MGPSCSSEDLSEKSRSLIPTPNHSPILARNFQQTKRYIFVYISLFHDSSPSPAPTSRLQFFSFSSTMAGLFIVLDAGLVLFAFFIVSKFYSRKSPHPPPGPRKWPLVGTLLDMPTSQEWLTFTAWGAHWGQCGHRLDNLLY